jgi:lipopolysaccharide export LptBFGC system permease protein LptF
MLDIQEQNKKQAENRFQIAKICLGSSLLVPLVSFLLSSVFLSTDGILSRVIAHKNYGLILQKKQQDFSQLETDIKARNKEQETFKQKISEIRDNKVLSGIIDRRIHWNEVFGAIENLTNKTFEGNKVSRYVTFKNYSGKSDKNQISIQGEVRNAEGKSWKDLIKLKDALNAHENFEGVIINQFVKQLASPDSRSSSSEYISPFSFQFHYLKDGKNSDSDAVVLNE